MGLIDLIKVSKKYGDKDILKEVSVSINDKDRISIIGQNGCGKSTLMKIVNNLVDLDDGKVVKQGDISVEYVHQAPVFPAQKVIDYMHDSMTELKELADKYNETINLLEKDVENEDLLHKSSNLANKLDFYDAWNMDSKVDILIEHFELETLKNRMINTLSGGEQKRVALASVMLKKSDILFLDEPTNHLDVYMVKFLENYLKKKNKTIVFVSHDRYFIDELATRVFEVENGLIRIYNGNYAEYLQRKSMLIEQKTKENNNMLRLLKDEEEWLRRGVKARKKRDEGRKKRVIGLRSSTKSNTSEIRAMSSALKKEQIQAPPVNKQSKKKVLFDIKNLVLRQGDKLLIDGFEGRILQRDKLAIVGKNGSGKSTFLKALLSQVPFEGRIKVGEFKIGYFDQGRNMLDDEKNLLETFCPMGGDTIAVNGKNMHVYGYLKKFLFPKEFLDKKIKSLSGGEKNRVALALLFSKETDCLILDEPTNDLDIATINILEEYLLGYKGSVLLVSHDRYFVDKIASKLLVIDSLNIETSYLKYSDYLSLEKSINELKELELKQKDIEPKIKPLIKEIQKTNQRKLSYKEKLEYQSLEKEIGILEKEIEDMNTTLSDPLKYEEIGIGKLSTMLDEANKSYSEKVNRFLELEEFTEIEVL